jgi:hypothetical protein
MGVFRLEANQPQILSVLFANDGLGAHGCSSPRFPSPEVLGSTCVKVPF